MEPPFQDNLSMMADSMGIALYQRFTLSEASLFLRCPVNEVKKLQRQGKLEYITVTDTQIEFFGYQLLQHLLNSVSGEVPKVANQTLPDKILRAKEVQDMTGLSRTTIWRLERKGEFPARVPLGAGSIGWRYREILNWVNSR
ncbi:MAG: AlpA family phage regulatory protein [Thiolinea sp.]